MLTMPARDEGKTAWLSATADDGQCDQAASAVRVSVIIPVYNSATTIVPLLDALLPQCAVHAEIIVVDDCSTDATAAVLEPYAGRGVTCLRTICNGGAAAARNRGAAAAQGEFLLFFDSDDVPSPVLLPTVLAALELCPDATFGGYLIATQLSHEPDPSVLKQSLSLPTVRWLARHAYARALLRGRWLVTASSAIVRKSLFDAHGGFRTDMRTYEDPELWSRLSSGTAFMQITDVLAIYRIPPSPGAGRTKAGAADDFVRSLRALSGQHGRLYALLADVVAVKAAVLARASGERAQRCLVSLRTAGVGLGGRTLSSLLIILAGPLLAPGLTLYRQMRRRRQQRQCRAS